MRTTLLTAVAILLCAGSIHAAPAQGYIGIFSDANHSVCSISPPANVPFDVWVWCLPGINGMIAAEFDVIFPSTVQVTAMVCNPNAAMRPGNCFGWPGMGISLAFDTCEMDWVYTHRFTCVSLAEGLPGEIAIGPHPTAGAYQFATCELGYPIEQIEYLTPLYLYQSCVYGTQESSWGAIKNLF